MDRYGFTWGNIQSIATLLVIIALAIGRTMWIAVEMKKTVKDLEKKVSAHIESPTLHRNPDSEQRWRRVESQLDRIELDILNLSKAGK